MGSLRGENRRINRRYTTACSAVLAALLANLPFTAPAAHAASATWSAAPTNGNWEAETTLNESNWSTGVGTFPGDATGTTTINTDAATFNGVSNITTILINSTDGSTAGLNLANITFNGASKSAYTIGTLTGNPLLLTSGASNQIVISGAGSSVAGNLETINAPIVIEPFDANTLGTYTFQNNSNLAGDVLVIAGPVTGGTTSQGITLTLRGAGTAANTVSGNITNGGAALGLSIVKTDAGAWTLAGVNSYTGNTSFSGGSAGSLIITGSYTGGGNFSVGSGGNSCTLNVNTTGTVSAANITLVSANATFLLSNGTVTANLVDSNGVSNSRNITLNGGVLQVLTAVNPTNAVPVNFNGGTLKSGSAGGITLESTTVSTTSNHLANVRAGGGTLDTSIGNITSTATLTGTLNGPITVTGGHTFTSSMNNNGLFTLNGASTWDLNGANLTSSVGGLAGTGTITNSNAAPATLTIIGGNTATFSGTIGNGASSIGLTVNSAAAGKQILAAANTFSGGTTLTAGTLQLAHTLALQNSTVNMNGGTLAFDAAANGNFTLGGLQNAAAASIALQDTAATPNPITLSIGNNNQATNYTGVLSGPGGFKKIGTATLTLGGINTATGNAAVSAGELDIASGGALANANVSVAANATLAVLSGGSLGTAPNLTVNGSASIANAAQNVGALNGSGTISLNAANLSVSAGGSFLGTINDNASGGALTVNNSALTTGGVQVASINANSVLRITAPGKTASLNIAGASGAWTGGLDLTGTQLVLNPASKATAIPQLQDQIAFGKSNPAGIFSSTMPANYGIALLDNAVLNKTTFGGLQVDANSLLLAPEILGDSNADGKVDLTDLSTVLNNFGSSTVAWTSGNFDGAATIDLTDLSDVLNNFGSSNPNPGDASAGASVAAAPEPTTLALLGLPAAFLLKRRRHA